MERILSTDQDPPKNQDNEMLSAKKDKDADMKDEAKQCRKNGDANNYDTSNLKLFRDSESDDEDQVMETDEFGKLHRELCKKTRKDIESERSSILGFLDELRADMVSQKQKIIKQTEKLYNLQNNNKDTKKQEELTKKQTNVCLTKNQQKAEQTFKNVVNSNKQYFETIASFG